MNAPFFFAANAALRTAFPRAKGSLILTLLILACLAALLPSTAHGQVYTESTTLPSASQRMSISGDTIVVGWVGNMPPHEDAPTLTSAVFVRSASGWTHQQSVQHKGGDAAVDGDTLVVGGSVYVRSGGTWTLQANLSLSDRMNNAIQGDTIVQAMPMDRTQDTGTLHVYVRNGTTWTFQGSLPPQAGRQRMGSSIALDGDTVIAGTDDWLNSGGGGYVYVRNGGTWSFQAKLSLSGAGAAMDVAIEGDTAAVSDPTNNRVGIFNRSGSSWTLVQTLTGGAGTNFGGRVVMRGGVLAVGVNTGSAVNLYTRDASGWVQAQTVSGTTNGDIALSEGGTTLVAGYPVYSTPPPPAPGTGWRDYDVGAVGVAGSSTDNGATVSVRGSGADIWGRADQFHYRSESLTGDGAIIARVDSAGSGHPWSKVGLMMRENIAPASRNVMALVTPGDHLGTQIRGATANTTEFQDAGWAGAPIWLMLARSGNLFAAYRSDDGDNWTPMGSATVNMPATVHLGLAVSSHDNAVLNTGTFSSVEIIGNLPPPPLPPPTNLSASLFNGTNVHLQWTDNSSGEDSFAVERSEGTGGGAYSRIGTTVANGVNYTDMGLRENTTYTYRVRALLGSAQSEPSNTFTITTTGSPWVGVDFGATPVAGTFSMSGGVTTVDAAGADIWNNADRGYFVFRNVTGDFDFRTQVSSLTNTHPWAKAGVMARDSTADVARNVFTLVTGDNVAGAQVREVTGGATAFTSGPWVRAPYWVRLVRTGNTFESWLSPNGVNWQLVRSQTLAMPATLQLGFAVSSHVATTPTRAVFTSTTLAN